MAKKQRAEASKSATKEVTNWASKPDSDIYVKCEGMYPTIREAYKNRKEADEAIEQYWSIFNGEADDNQMYAGNSKCYLPVVRDAIGARAKRSLKQLFPNKYRHVEAVGNDNQDPKPQLALLEHYIRLTKLKSIVRSVLIAGDVTGQWNLYIDWQKTTRNVSGIIKRNPIMGTVDGSELEIEDPTEEVDESTDEEVTEQGPDIVDFATEDLVVIPPTCNDINKAEISCLKLRMSKDQIKKLVDEDVFILPEGGDLSDWISERKGKEDVVPEKKRTGDAGIKTEGTLKYALIYWAQAYLKPDKDKPKCLMDIYFAGENEIVGIIKAPQWGQKRSIISAPVERVAGSFNGISKIEAVKTLQWNLNDFWNMGQDSAMYSLLPIVMTDPEKNPNYAMMVYGLAAVWPVDPKSTQMTSFPALWKDAAGMCENIKAQIHQSLDVNEMMMGAMPKGRKNNAAMGAQQMEQSVAVTDNAERFEEEIMNPLMERIFEYDSQYRDEELTVLTQGEIGVKASMQSIPLQQWGERYFFQWTGTAFTMNMQRMQQQIATMNVLRGIPPQQLNGRKLDITPILEYLVDNVFGVEMGAKILIDDRNKYSVPPEIEDEMLINGILVEVHEGDDDQQHLQAHQPVAQKTGDPTGLLRTHMQGHMKQMQEKRQKAMAAQQPPQPQGQPGVPGGAGPGVPGSPRMGAQPAPQRPMQQPPGSQPVPQ